MKYVRVLFFFVVLVLVVTSFAQDDPIPDQMVVDCGGCAPEGIEYDLEGGRFLIGSITYGTIFAVYDDGTVTPFIEDEELSATGGIHIDVERNRLLVPNIVVDDVFELLRGTMPERIPISLAAYDLTTGDRLFFTDLTDVGPDGLHLVEDVAVDIEGNAYVTDAYSTVIYKVDLEGNASVFVENERFAVAQGAFGLNGIEYHPDGYLLVAVSAQNRLFKVPLDDPTQITEVNIDQMLIVPDGMVWHPNGNLIVVALGQNRVVSLTSDDDWASATIEATFDTGQQVTTVAIRGEEVYALYPHGFNPNSEYDIVRVQFEDVQE